MIDQQGFRLNVGIIIINAQDKLFWGKRVGHNAWQFPQGGLIEGESPEEALYRELKEEIGLNKSDVQILSSSKNWLKYRLPRQFIRSHSKPRVIGQKQKWFLLRLLSPDSHIRLDLSSKPEFEAWRWVNYWYPVREVIYFKRYVYKRVLREFESIVFTQSPKTSD